MYKISQNKIDKVPNLTLVYIKKYLATNPQVRKQEHFKNRLTYYMSKM